MEPRHGTKAWYFINNANAIRVGKKKITLQRTYISKSCLTNTKYYILRSPTWLPKAYNSYHLLSMVENRPVALVESVVASLVGQANVGIKWFDLIDLQLYSNCPRRHNSLEYFGNSLMYGSIQNIKPGSCAHHLHVSPAFPSTTSQPVGSTLQSDE